MLHVLFVCGRNRLRSPTAEQIYAEYPRIVVRSAGTRTDADVPLSAELVRWADIIFVMERAQQSKLRAQFASQLKSQRVVCLNVADKYQFMQPELVTLLRRKIDPYLPSH